MGRPARRGRDRTRSPGPAPVHWADIEELAQLAASAGELDVQVKRISAPQARKAYICPGCQQEIAVGMAHVVVVPREAPDLRRHWHTPCWLMRSRRHPGR